METDPQTQALCRYWNHLQSPAPFPWGNKCYVKVIGQQIYADTFIANHNKSLFSMIADQQISLQVMESPHSVVLPGYTGGARDCLPPLWPSLSQSGLNMNLIWNKISKQIFRCYYPSVESYKKNFPSNISNFSGFYILLGQNPSPSDSGLSVFLLHSPKYSKNAADVVCRRDGKSRYM